MKQRCLKDKGRVKKLREYTFSVFHLSGLDDQLLLTQLYCHDAIYTTQSPILLQINFYIKILLYCCLSDF